MADAAPPPSMRVEVLEKTSALITAAFGLIAALAWNEAISEAVALYLQAGGALVGLFVYAVLVTILAVVAVIAISRAAARAKAAGPLRRTA